jgi:uncharacterized protein YecT (DUF1311 family)
MRPVILLAAAGFLHSAAPLFAQGVDCDAATDQATLNQCASEAYASVDAQLNDAYRQIERRLDGDDDLQDRLTRAQRAWIAFRDAECTFATANSEGGSAYSMLQNTCLANLTNARLDDLNALLACEEGDLSCPVPAE